MFGYTASELYSIFIMQGFAGLSLFSVLLLMALGLAIIFGQMGVVNLAHGEFMALGAYTVYLCSTLVQNHAPGLAPYYFLVAIVIAFFVAGLAGLLVEWSLIRFLYKRPLDTLLATWGLSLIMQQAFRTIFGARVVDQRLVRDRRDRHVRGAVLSVPPRAHEPRRVDTEGDRGALAAGHVQVADGTRRSHVERRVRAPRLEHAAAGCQHRHVQSQRMELHGQQRSRVRRPPR